MKTFKQKHIVVVLTNKGYVAIENGELFELWKDKNLKQIYGILRERYPDFELHLGSLDLVDYEDAIKTSKKYLKRYLKMTSKEAKALINQSNRASILKDNLSSINYAIRKGLGKGIEATASIIHFTFQSAADLSKRSEAFLLDKLDVAELPLEEMAKTTSEKGPDFKQKISSRLRYLQTVSRGFSRRLLRNQ